MKSGMHLSYFFMIKIKKSDKIYPISDIRKKGMINDQYGNKKVVIFYRDNKISILDESNIKESKTTGSATAFSRVLKGQTLTFSKKNVYFTDHQTRSK